MTVRCSQSSILEVTRLAVGSSLIRQLLVRKQAHISFARTKIILARAIFYEIHGVRSNFLHGLPVELRTVGYISFPVPFFSALEKKRNPVM